MSYAKGQTEESKNIKIVTLDSPQHAVLRQKAEKIKSGEFPLAKEVEEQLRKALQHHLPAAGLAAPQIGISKAVFIYSYDRDPKNLEVAVNPEYSPIGEEKIEGWEGCFSCTLSQGTQKLAKLPRYAKIKAVYFNSDGEQITKILEGFGAKVFQHEYDHLQGIVCVDHKDAEVKTFATKEMMERFLDEVKKNDSKRYLPPKT
jgi:N-formylmethionyl-tRNA deformylase